MSESVTKVGIELLGQLKKLSVFSFTWILFLHLFLRFFFYISISPESCGKEEKFGKLTENISTITVTTFAMVFL